MSDFMSILMIAGVIALLVGVAANAALGLTEGDA